jgi:DNA polymerase (family X)
MTRNDEVARALAELARLTAIDEGDPNAFRVRAYQNAARAIEVLGRDVAGMTTIELTQVKGIGKSTAGKIRQFLDEGRIDKLEQLRAKYPPGQLELLRVPGLGPKTVALLGDVLGVHDLAGLEAAIAEGRLTALPGMGEKLQENLRDAIVRMRTASKEHRRPIAEVHPVADALLDRLRLVPRVVAADVAGSLRRFRETIGDVDLLVASSDPAPVMEALARHHLVHQVTASGDTKTSIVTHDGLQVDLRVVPPDAYGAALIYFTGSKPHNIRLRQRAIGRGWKLSEYALEDAENGTVVAGATEEEVYAALGLSWITPELREDDGEIELAATGDLPVLPELADLRGDLHDHTDWSGDGRNSLEEMVAAASDRGFEYFAITDHAENLTINGISMDAMRAQRRRLRELQEQYPRLRLLHGAELNIGIDGSLDYTPEFLATFDWCVASIHSHFRRPAREQTARLIAAMRQPAVTAIGHLSGRMLGRRDGVEFDLDAVLDVAVETGTAIEINANLRRLDASAEVIREGARRGVKFVISTDAHTIRELDNHRHGIRQARRGGLPRDLVVNTWDTDRFLAWVADVKMPG